jgi:integrase
MAGANHTRPKTGFTTAWLDNVKPKSKRIEYADAGCRGLRLRVEPTGRKSFVWYYREGGRNRVLTLGRYGTCESCISLKDARKALQVAKEKHEDGVSPALPTDTPTTVEELAEIFYARRILPHRKVPEVVRMILDNDIIPKLGKMKLATLSAPVIATMIEQVVDRGARTHAGKVLAIAKQMFRFAEARGWIDRSPAYALDKKDLSIVDNVRDRHLSAEEIQALWQALDNYKRLSVQVKLGIQVLLLTGVRTAELLQAKWEHIQDNEWFIPEENSKTTAWTVPIVPAVASLLDELQEIADHFESDWVMASTTDEPLSDKALARAIRRLRDKKDDKGKLLLDIPDFTPHDFRRTLRTHLEDLDVPPYVAEKCLNHSLGRIERTYNRNELLEQRREALQKWADFVYLSVTPRDNVAAPQG